MPQLRTTLRVVLGDYVSTGDFVSLSLSTLPVRIIYELESMIRWKQIDDWWITIYDWWYRIDGSIGWWMIGRIRPADRIGQGSCALKAIDQNRDVIRISGCESGCDAKPGFGMRIWYDGFGESVIPFGIGLWITFWITGFVGNQSTLCKDFRESTLKVDLYRTDSFYPSCHRCVTPLPYESLTATEHYGYSLPYGIGIQKYYHTSLFAESGIVQLFSYSQIVCFWTPKLRIPVEKRKLQVISGDVCKVSHPRNFKQLESMSLKYSDA